MESLILGEVVEPNELKKFMEKLSSYPHVCENWKNLGETLEVDELILVNLEDNIVNDRMKPHDVLHEILLAWTEQYARDATLHVLLEALRTCQIHDTADILEKTYLQKSFQFKLYEKSFSLSELKKFISKEKVEVILHKLNGSACRLPMQLLRRDVIPKDELKHYISRTLSVKNQVSEDIFNIDQTHLLLFKGITKEELASLSGSKFVDSSNNQLNEDNVRFMTLDRDDDFDAICNVTSRPVHLIEHKSGSYYWVRSSKAFDSIEGLFKENFLPEEDFISKVKNDFSSHVFIISGSAGMGKSTFLAQWTSKFNGMCRTIAILVQLNQFTQSLMEPIDSPSSAIAALANFVSSSEVSKIVLEEIMKNKDYTIGLFLDAYETVKTDKLVTTESFLNQVKQQGNFRIFLATRPHMVCRLATIPNTTLWEIMPLNKADQIQVLSQYWNGMKIGKSGKWLEDYATIFYRKLQELQKIGEQDIAGNPLHCTMIAECFANGTAKASTSYPSSVVDIACLFKVYRTLVDTQFGRTPEIPFKFLRVMNWYNPSAKAKYVNRLVQEAIALLFPGWLEKFKHLLKGIHEIEMDTLYSMGLIEIVPERGGGKAARFVHQTIAEYLLAQYLVKHLTKQNECIQMLFGVIISAEKAEPTLSQNHSKKYELKHPRIALFVNMLLKHHMEVMDSNLDQMVKSIPTDWNKIEFENLCKVIMALQGNKDMQVCFDLTVKLFKHQNLGQINPVLMKDIYYKYLPHIAVQRSKDCELVATVLDFAKHEFNADLSFHINNSISSFPWILGCTPLHLAIYYGRLNVFTHLINQYGDQLQNLKLLVHMCVRDSKNDNIDIIEDKMTILEILLAKANEYDMKLEECIFDGQKDSNEMDIHSKLWNRLHDIGILGEHKRTNSEGAERDANTEVKRRTANEDELREEDHWLRVVKSLKLKLPKRVEFLGKLLQADSEEIYQIIYNELKNDTYTPPIQLLKKDVMPKAKEDYYVSRTLFCRNLVDEKIFRPDPNQKYLLLVKGIKKDQLVKLCQAKCVDVSSNQLNKVTVRFMVLQKNDDFDQICLQTTQPVHIIEQKHDSYHWVRSNKGLANIQHYFLKKKLEALSEQEFITNAILGINSKAVIISDSAGMGKSVLVEKLAKKLNPKHSITLVIMLDAFARLMIQPIDSTLSALKAVADYSCSCRVSKIIMLELMKNPFCKTNLFLDSYDAVSQDKLSLVDSFLNKVKEFNNFRILVTTRPHLRARLEDVLDTIAYEIMPFNNLSQIEFLTKYWVSKHFAQRSEGLQNYAKKCLETLYELTQDKEEDLVGNPRNCAAIADRFGDDARVESIKDSESSGTVKITDLLDTYKSLVDVSFENSSKSNNWLKGSIKTNYINAHIHQSLVALFSEWVGKFEQQLQGFQQVDESKLYSIGLIEKDSVEDKRRFLYKTFAEYVLAEYLIKNLSKHDKVIHMLFGAILGGDGVVVYEQSNPSTKYELKHHTLAYLVNTKLKEQIEVWGNSLNVMLMNTPKMWNLTEIQNLCKGIVTLCGNPDLDLCFDLSTKVFLQLDLGHIKKEDLINIRDEYFKYLPHLAVERSQSVELVESVLEFTKNVFNIDLSYHIYTTDKPTTFPWISGSTPLHVAVYHGNFLMATYLVHEYGDRLVELKYLLNATVYRSGDNDETVINGKLRIIDTILRYNLSWLGETFQERAPLLEDNVHSKLLCRLIEAGADVNTYSQYQGTLLHTSNINANYRHLLRWTLSAGFNLINHTDYLGRTPLAHFVSQLERSIPETEETLELFYNARADFNAKDQNADSVLFYALENNETTLKFVQLILDYGGDVNHLNEKESSAAHVLMYALNSLSDETFDYREVLHKLKLLISHGFNRLNHKNSEGLTFLDIVLNNVKAFRYMELFEYLQVNGVDFRSKRDLIETINPTLHTRIRDFGLYDLKLPSASNIETLPFENSMLSLSISSKVSYNASPLSMLTGETKIVPDYKKLIGQGSGSKVYEGKYGSKTVAVKAIRVLKNGVENLKRETEILVNCDSHENIIRYFGESRREFKGYIRYLLAMELCDSTLREFVENKELSLGKLKLAMEPFPIQILRQITNGIYHLHNLKNPIIHGDLKPENVLLTAKNGKVVAKLTDSGIRYILAQDNTLKTCSRFAGTTEWMAPETLNALLSYKEYIHVTKQVDIFSLGCLFYYVLSGGKHPFPERIPASKAEYSPKLDVDSIGHHPSHYNFLRLILFMISYEEWERPSIENVKNHHAFWMPEKSLSFLQESVTMSSQPELMRIENWLRKNYEKLAGRNASNLDLIFSDEVGLDNGWLNCVSDDVNNFQLPHSKRPMMCNGKSFVDLLRGLRNFSVHFNEFQAHSQNEIVPTPDNLLNYWQSKSRFPFLFDYLWTAVQSIDCRPLREYYNGINFDFSKIMRNEDKFVV